MNMHKLYNTKILKYVSDRLYYRKIKQYNNGRGVYEPLGIDNNVYYRTQYRSKQNKELVEACKAGDRLYIHEYCMKRVGDAKCYDEYLINRQSMRLVGKYICDNFENCRILDVACGHGELDVFLQQKGFHMFGLDLNEYRCDALKNVIEEIRCEDVEETSYENESFKVIISLEMLEHVSDIELTLKKLNDLLIHEGVLIITTPNEYLIDDDSHVRIFTKQSLKDILYKCGFNVKIICTLPYLNGEKDNDLFCVAYKQ